MSNNFITAIKFTLPWEVGKDKRGNLRQDGGYTDDPRDPGGETKWGISKRANPDVDIKNLTLAQAIEIYKTKYWDVYKNFKRDPISLDDLPTDLAVAIFDTGVNCGVSRCYNWYQIAKKEEAPVDKLLELRREHYLKLPTYTTFGKGWMNRLNDLDKFIEISTDEFPSKS